MVNLATLTFVNGLWLKIFPDMYNTTPSAFPKIKDKGKLKLKTPLWLRSEELSRYVVGFTNLPNNRGGEGALFVKLKNVNKYS